MHKLLIANRGEIARRIVRTAKRLGIRSAVACSEADVDSPAVREADESIVIGPAPSQQSYLNIEAVLNAARTVEAEAIHPGFGFLSENAEFAESVIDAGLTWVGPSPESIRLMGDKVAALQAAEAAGVPTLAGSRGAVGSDEEAQRIADEIGFPLIIKASAGGGGRGIRVVSDRSDFGSALDLVRSEARSTFNDSTVYIERFVERGRHVEVQILGDGSAAIHLGDRDCSMQRRSQKVLEEAPAPHLPDHVRETIRRTSVELALRSHYTGAGTVEFLYDPAAQEAAFIEMNTRLQVEHPVTEMVTGIDLVEHQLRVAEGEALSLTQNDVTFTGHAFECRINAEDPTRNFFPSPGTITLLHWPSRPSVRVDSGADEGTEITPFYDSMIAKVIVSASDRVAALRELPQVLDEVQIEGVVTTLPMLRRLASRPELAEVTHHTNFIEETPSVFPEVEQS